MLQFAEVMQHFSAEPSTDNRADADGEKGKSHVSALLLCGRELGDVFVILRGLSDFAEGENENREHGSPVTGPQSKDQPGQSGNEGAENHGTKRRDLLNEVIPGESKANHDGGVDAEDAFHASVGIDEVVDIAGQQRELLPENDPVAGEDQKKQHEPGIGKHGEKVLSGDSERWRRRRRGLRLGFPEKEQDEENHGKDAEGSDAKDIFHAKFCVRPIGDHWADRAADIDHRVVDGISDGADVFFGSARGSAHHTGLDESDSERWQKEHDADEQSQRHRVANRAQPRRADRTEEEVRTAQDEVSEGKGAAKSEPVCDSAAEDGEEPDGSSKKPGEGTGLLGGEIEFLVEIQSERGKGTVVREALENFADVSDPEGALEAIADFLEALGERHARG